MWSDMITPLCCKVMHTHALCIVKHKMLRDEGASPYSTVPLMGVVRYLEAVYSTFQGKAVWIVYYETCYSVSHVQSQVRLLLTDNALAAN